MAIKHIRPGQDFDFDPAFGFTGSARGRHDARNLPNRAVDDAYGDGAYRDDPAAEQNVRGAQSVPELRASRGGRARKAMGGTVDAEYEPKMLSTEAGINEPNPNIRRGGHPHAYAGGGRVKRAMGGPAMPPGQAPGNPMAANPLGNATISMPVKDMAAAGARALMAGVSMGAKGALGGAANRAQAIMGGPRPGMAPAGMPPAAPAPQGLPAMKKGGRMRAARGGRACYADGGKVEDETRGDAKRAFRRAMEDDAADADARHMSGTNGPARDTNFRFERDEVAPDAGPTRAKKGGFIAGAIKHPGRMKNAAKRAGVSTHEYMEEHKDAPGSLGRAARLGLRLTGGDLKPHRKKG